ncbi:mechanosensitive ion channel domain-containing protein [Luteibaculum oceani]|uniref:Mechanosensitive ion channel n=1 Tax=Luteibaculum oceani TaxID=1294296 RepID=A0A5C6UUI6_9FLAO|nr:mechanosensitive ion channel domain-containing protein [Luteibaculum oceani]TXC76264.1 mechanosensitive ion channel [Luteibaculum oceani]
MINSDFSYWTEHPLIQKALITSGVIVVIFLIRLLLRKALNRSVKTNDNKYKARKALNLFSYLLIVLAILLIFNEQLGNIGIVVGVAGAGITFALQEPIMSVAGWLHILINSPISVGQRVKIGDVQGDIIDIGVLSTTIMEMGDWVDGDLFNGRIVSLSNSYVFKEPIHNYSGEYPFLWDEIIIPVRTECNYLLAQEKFQEVLEEICGSYAKASEMQWKLLANKFRVEEANVQPSIFLRFDENWISFTLRYIVDYKKRRSTKHQLYSRILQEVAKHPTEIKIATSSIEISHYPIQQ